MKRIFRQKQKTVSGIEWQTMPPDEIVKNMKRGAREIKKEMRAYTVTSASQ